MFPFKVYLDSDSYIMCRNDAEATRLFNERVSKGLFAMIVEQVGTCFVCQTVWFEGEQSYSESQFTKLLQSL